MVHEKVIVALVLIGFVTTGCTGSFMLTKKIYNWHRSLGDKWADEFGFLVCALLPIYGFGTLADAIVFNSIEFWTGDNPVDNVKAETNTKVVKTEEGDATLSYTASPNNLTIASQKKGLQSATISLEKTGDTVTTKDKAGNLLYTTTKNENGDFLVYNRNAELVRSYSKAEIDALKNK